MKDWRCEPAKVLLGSIPGYIRLLTMTHTIAVALCGLYATNMDCSATVSGIIGKKSAQSRAQTALRAKKAASRAKVSALFQEPAQHADS